VVDKDEFWLLYEKGAVLWNENEWHIHPLTVQRSDEYSRVYCLYEFDESHYWFGGEGWLEE